jgi:hypothetical protein
MIELRLSAGACLDFDFFRFRGATPFYFCLTLDLTLDYCLDFSLSHSLARFNQLNWLDLAGSGPCSCMCINQLGSVSVALGIENREAQAKSFDSITKNAKSQQSCR